jgi:hypothetical protein
MYWANNNDPTLEELGLAALFDDGALFDGDMVRSPYTTHTPTRPRAISRSDDVPPESSTDLSVRRVPVVVQAALVMYLVLVVRGGRKSGRTTALPKYAIVTTPVDVSEEQLYELRGPNNDKIEFLSCD